MPEGSRPNRVSEEFREILAEEIPKLKDPRVGFVTVLGVTVTPDLRLARVFYTTLGDDRAHRATAAALASARGHLRKVIGTQVRMKVLPELRFEQEDAQGGTGPDRAAAPGAARAGGDVTTTDQLARAAEALSEAPTDRARLSREPRRGRARLDAGPLEPPAWPRQADGVLVPERPVRAPAVGLDAPGDRRARPAVRVPEGPGRDGHVRRRVARPAGVAGGSAVRATTLIWIDHHVTNEGLGTIPIIDPSASSTCELVWRLLKVLGGEIRVETAMCSVRGARHRHRTVPVRGGRTGHAPPGGRAPRVPVRPHEAGAGALRGPRCRVPEAARRRARAGPRRPRRRPRVDLPHAGRPGGGRPGTRATPTT